MINKNRLFLTCMLEQARIKKYTLKKKIVKSFCNTTLSFKIFFFDDLINFNLRFFKNQKESNRNIAWNSVVSIKNNMFRYQHRSIIGSDII